MTEPSEIAGHSAGTRLGWLLSSKVVRGLSVGLVALGANYAAQAAWNIPVLPEQAGAAFLRVLPLRAFSLSVGLLGGLARPLLLVSITIVLVLIIGTSAALAQRLPRARPLALAGAVVLGSSALAAVSSVPAHLTEIATEAIVVGAVAGVTLWALEAVRAGDSSPLAPGRRQFLRGLLLGVVGLAGASLGYIDIKRLVQGATSPLPRGPVTELTPVSQFYKVSKNLDADPAVDGAAWRLELPDGRRLTYPELLAVPAQQLELTLECISNEVGGNLISNGRWRGPRLVDLLPAAPAGAGARYLLMEAADGYQESFPLAALTPDCLLATHLNSAPLTPEHGFPARVLLPGHYGMKQPKWLTRLSLAPDDRAGFWEVRGWDEKSVVKTMSRIDRPAGGEHIAAGTATISGIAFSGARRISAVEISQDGGPWQPAELNQEFSAYSWRFWHAALQLPPGHHAVRVRARDGLGRLQSAEVVDPLPKGSDGLHAVGFDAV